MALRHPFPKCVLPDYRLPVEPVRAPVLPRPPREVKYRPGKDIQEVVAEVSGYAYVKIVASVGAGKSTAIPVALAKAYGKVVIHMVPSQLLAMSLHKYLKGTDVGADTEMVLNPDEQFPKAGVVLTTYACVVAKMVIGRNTKAPLGDAVLYADEIHESDCYTYVVSQLGPSYPGITAFVKATATPDHDRFPMRETAGEVIAKQFPAVPPREWDPLEMGKPWSAVGQTGNVLMFVDNDRVADRLVGAYNGAGATAYRLTAKMDPQLFMEAMAAVNNVRGGIVFLVADYAFRNGFDYDITTHVDSGEVRFYEVDGGEMKTRYRPVYNLENYQGMGRGGRRPGSMLTCWNPPIKLKNAICALEGVEMEAAAVLFRVLGYAPPAEIRNAYFCASKTVPRDLEKSLNAFEPLTIQSADLMTELVYEAQLPADTGIDAEDVLQSYGDSPVADRHDYFGDNLAEPAGASLRILDSARFLEELGSISAAASTLEWPHYYACHGVVLREQELPRYGYNWKALVSDLLRQDYLPYSFSLTERTQIISMLLLRYNMCVSQVAAANRVLDVKTGLSVLASQHPELVKKWSEWLAAHVREHEAVGKSVLAAVGKLRVDSMYFVGVPPDTDYELELAKGMAEKLKAVVGRAKQAVDPGSIFAAMRTVTAAAIGQSETVPLLAAAGGAVDGAAIHDVVQVSVKPVRVAGRQMHNFTLAVDQSVVWSEDDYVTTLQYILKRRGYSVSTIRYLYLPGTSVDPNRVLQTLKDRGIATHRASVSFKMKTIAGST